MEIDATNEVQTLYVAYFGRPADPVGLNFWKTQLLSNPDFYPTASAAFSTSNEFQTMYGGLNRWGLVEKIYDNLFGRAPDQAGLDFWVGALEQGTITVSNAVTFIANGALNNDRVVINGRVAVATAFTERVDTAQETLAYSGPAANRIAHDYVGGVRDLTTAALHMDPGQIDATIARIVGVPGVVEMDVMMA